MKDQINNQKVSAVIKSHNNWIKEHTDYWIPSPQFIKNWISIPYNRWYVGITKFKDNTRLIQHLKKSEFDGLYFKILDVGTMQQANMIEAYFSKLGTKNAPESRGAKPESIYAYVFKADANIAEKIFAILN